MKADKQHSALEVIKKEQLKRRVFSVEFKAEEMSYKKAENLSLSECFENSKCVTAASNSISFRRLCRSAIDHRRHSTNPGQCAIGMGGQFGGGGNRLWEQAVGTG